MGQGRQRYEASGGFWGLSERKARHQKIEGKQAGWHTGWGQGPSHGVTSLFSSFFSTSLLEENMKNRRTDTDVH